MHASVRVAAGDAQQLIDRWLAATAGRRAVLVEGAFQALDVPADVTLARLPRGCVCCVGLVPLRVGVTRAVRAVRPDALLLVLSTDGHLQRVRELLSSGDLGIQAEVD